MRRFVAACLCLAGFSSAHALPGVTLDGSWHHERQFDTDLMASGYGLGISVDLGPYVFVGGSYSRVQTESFEDALDGVEGRLDYQTAGADLGVVWPWTAHLGTTATGGYATSTTRGLDGFRNDLPARSEGPTGSLALWYVPDSRVSFSVGGGYSHLGGIPGWDASAGLGLRLWRQLWLNGGYWRGEGIEGWTAGLSAYFPPKRPRTR